MARDLDYLLGDAQRALDPPLARRNYGGTAAPLDRLGCGIHFDASSNDRSAVQWFSDPNFKLSYNEAFTDDGRVVLLTPSIWTVAYHFGVCSTPPANSNRAYFGLAITATDGDTVTEKQFSRIAYHCAIMTRYMREEVQHPGWCGDLTDRLFETIIVGHQERAIFNRKDNPDTPALWGKLGRKHDPIGRDVNHPVLSLVSLRIAVSLLLASPDSDCWIRWKA